MRDNTTTVDDLRFNVLRTFNCIYGAVQGYVISYHDFCHVDYRLPLSRLGIVQVNLTLHSLLHRFGKVQTSLALRSLLQKFFLLQAKKRPCGPSGGV